MPQYNLKLETRTCLTKERGERREKMKAVTDLNFEVFKQENDFSSWTLILPAENTRKQYPKHPCR